MINQATTKIDSNLVGKIAWKTPKWIYGGHGVFLNNAGKVMYFLKALEILSRI